MKLRMSKMVPVSCSLQGVEHLLSALEMLGVDNARIEVEGGSEIPIVDGSALGWTVDVQSVSASAPRARPGLTSGLAVALTQRC